MGDHEAAIQAFRAALNGQSDSRTEAIDVQYFLARTLESVGQIAEAATLYRRIAQMNPRFKDAAYRAKELSSKQKHPTNGKRGGDEQPILVRQCHREFQPAYRQS
jgi:tetratricopeptide (TPR) repeat protein